MQPGEEKVTPQAAGDGGGKPIMIARQLRSSSTLMGGHGQQGAADRPVVGLFAASSDQIHDGDEVGKGSYVEKK